MSLKEHKKLLLLRTTIKPLVENLLQSLYRDFL